MQPLAIPAMIACAVALLTTTLALAKPTPEQQCQATKSKVAGKYAACRQNAEAKLATTGDAMKYDQTLTKCGMSLASAWQKAIDKAASAGATCLDDPLTAGDFQTAIDDHTDAVATALGGGGLSQCPADLVTTGQTACYDASGTVVACAGTGYDGELQEGLTRSYTDNGDGTITDNRTGLMWEKLSDDGSIHDWHVTDTWPNAFALKVAVLNSASFAGYADWRVPNLVELQTLVHYGEVNPAVDAIFHTACTPGCSVTMCSCTHSVSYWSSTAYRNSPSNAWVVDFFDGNAFAIAKTSSSNVRAVRGGS